MEVDVEEDGDIEENYKETEKEKITNQNKLNNDDKQYEQINEHEMIRERLKHMLHLKSLDIRQHKLARVGGGGICGYNCIYLLSTGSKEMAEEILRNKNIDIVDNWEIYKSSLNSHMLKGWGTNQGHLIQRMSS